MMLEVCVLAMVEGSGGYIAYRRFGSKVEYRLFGGYGDRLKW